MDAGESRIQIDASIELARALRAYNGLVKIYIEDFYNANNNYLFTIDCGNFDDLYNLEILVPYQEEKYQEAEHLLEEKKYDEAAEAFRALGDYKDSPTRVEEIAELKKADAYATAEGLLEEKKYDEAAEVFRALGDYKDSPARVEEAKKIARQIVGSTIEFGTYEQDNDTSNGKEPIEWLVLDKAGTKLLLLSNYALDQGVFSKQYSTNSWELCSLRGWLNDTFLNTAFNNAEQSMIIESDNSNKSVINDVLTDGVDIGGKITKDMVFLLSAEEASKYLILASKMCQATEYAKSKGVYTDKDNRCFWWLRSPGFSIFSGLSVNTLGKTHDNASYDTKIYGVRPAIWVDSDSVIKSVMKNE